MLYKRLLSILTVFSLILVFAGCQKPEEQGENSKSKDTESAVNFEQESTSQSLETDNLESAPLPTEADTGISGAKNTGINNGSRFLKVGENIYYREYTSENYEQIGIFGEFWPVPNTSTKINRIDSSGQIKTLFEADGAREFYYLGGRLYFNSLYYGEETFSLDLKGENLKSFKNVLILHCDDERGIILFSLQDGIIVYDAETDKGKMIPKALFVDYDTQNGVIYFEQPVEYNSEQFEMSQYGQVVLYSINADGTDRHMLAATEPDLYEIPVGTKIISLQRVEDYIYFSYGGYSGSGSFFQGGNISRVKTDGSGYEKITAVGGRGEFCVLKERKESRIIFDKAVDGGEQELVSLSLATGEVTSLGENEVFEEYRGKTNGKPFLDNEDNICVYVSNGEKKRQLVSYDELRQLGFIKNSSAYNEFPRLYELEYADGNVFFKIEKMKESPENNIGWRTAYERVSTKVYHKNLRTAKINLLFEY